VRRSAFLASFTALALTLAACGSDSSSSASSTTASGSDSTSTADSTADSTAGTDTTVAVKSAFTKPTVKLPATLPTKLEKTELKAGSGQAAATGDTVVVHYVGVLSKDGTEFDNSYDRAQSFPVAIGQGQVIKGWDEGLVGVQTGGQYQLDIPADLAYGDQGSGDVIKGGDAITFVIDVLAVLTPGTAADEPKVTAPTSSGAKDVETEDLVDGTGKMAEAGDDVYVELVAYRGDSGEKIDSSWGNGGPAALKLTSDGALPGLVTGIAGMKVGGRRQIIIPSAQAFGEAGNTDVSIPGNTDLVVIIDLIAAFKS